MVLSDLRAEIESDVRAEIGSEYEDDIRRVTDLILEHRAQEAERIAPGYEDTMEACAMRARARQLRELKSK